MAALGYPVQRALRNEQLSLTNGFLADRAQVGTRAGGAPLELAGLTPIMQVSFQRHPIVVAIDTGATSTTMISRFRRLLGPKLDARTDTTRQSSGIGGVIAVKGSTLAGATFWIGDWSTPPRILFVSNARGVEPDVAYGTFGQDILGDGDSCLFDFTNGRVFLH